MEEEKIKFTICGLIVDCYFQLSKFLAEKMYKSFPEMYDQPQIRGMLDLQWDEYILKVKREVGGRVWYIHQKVIVFRNGELLGNEKDLMLYIQKTYMFSGLSDFYTTGLIDLRNYLLDITSKYRQMVYLTIEINRKVIGSMLFELYNDLVPITCENFLKRCESFNEDGYSGKEIHRIVANSFIQCGSWCWPSDIWRNMRCENYVIPHERRGILGMCNAGRHKDNTTQFFITLDPTTWMNYKYVAFGQLIQGNYVLKEIEKVPTKNEEPIVPIEIVRAGEFRVFPFRDEMELVTGKDLEYMFDMEKIGKEIFPEPDSVMDISKLMKGMYSLQPYKKDFLPIVQLPEYLMKYVKQTLPGEGPCDSSQPSTPCSQFEQLFSTTTSDVSVITL